jgi:glucose/arabinose dehydrogenase
MTPRSAIALATVSSCLLTAAASGGTLELGTVRVASGLDRPVFVTHAPGDTDRLFIVEQKGIIKILDLDSGVVLGTPFLDIDALVPFISGNDERGLLGLAFHPDYDTNGFFYVYYTTLSSDSQIRRYTVSANPDIADTSTAFNIMFIDQPFTNHNGGWIDFSPVDGYLYIGTGDGGSACDPSERSQDLTSQPLGKMLRIDVDGGSPYAIPGDNPFIGLTDEVWSYGLRNPWRCSFDRETGDLYMADVGQNVREEIDFQPFDSTGGENYGWDCEEGIGCASDSFQCTGDDGCTCGQGGLVDPIQEYSHAFGFSITGGYVYRGSAIPPLHGTYFYGDFGTSRTWSFVYDGNSVMQFQERTSELSPSEDGFTVSSISSFGEDANGEIYIVDRCSTTCGEVFQIIATSLPCPWDLDGSGSVGTADLLDLLSAWGPNAGHPADFDGDGNVATADLLKLLSMWGPCP